MDFNDAVNDDLDIFLTEFGKDIIWSGSAESIRAVFTASEEVVIGNILTTAPKIMVKSSDVTGLSGNDTFAVSGTTYSILQAMPDASGMKDIFLTED